MATRDVGNLRTRLSIDDQGTTRSLSRLKEDLRGLRSEMRTVTSQGRDYSNSLKGLRQQQDILNRQMRVHRERVQELNRRYREAVKVKGEDSKEARSLSRQINNVTSQMHKTEQQLDKVNKAIEEQINPWRKLGREAQEAGEKMQSVGQSLSSFGRDYSMKVTAPIVASGTAMFKAAMDFESAFAGVRKTVDETEEGYARLAQGIRDMAKELPASAEEIASVAEMAGQLGIQNDSILEFTRTIIDLGESTNLSLEQAGSEFARFANIVGMSQKDFDRLGSSIVSLGNNMATTESEIMSMAMRLAAQGAQVGMTEAQIVALAATMSSLDIAAEAGGTAMTTVLKRIQTAVDEGGEALAGFAKAAGVSSSEFAKVWEEDAIAALDLFIKGLANSSAEGENLTAILSDLGIKGIRESDTVLRLAGASDLLAEAVDNSTRAWKENTALSDEAAQRYETTESQLKILWNRIKDVGIELGQVLIPAFMDAIDAAEPFIRKIEEGAKAFSDMSREEQETILKMIGLVAAVGPASIALGGLTSGIGGVLKAGGKLSELLGKSGSGKGGGAGLLGSLGLMGSKAGPVGLAVVGLGGLAYWLYSSAENAEKLHDVNYDLINSINEEITSMDELTARFEELHNKNRLTTDEMLRYMDIVDELKEAKSEEAIAALTEEQQKLLEKSGLTNEEMQEFLDLNNKIVEETPNVTSAISDQGNAYIDNLNTLKELNAEKREELLMNAQRELEKALENENKLLRDQKNLEKEIKDIKQEINEVQQQRLDKMAELELEEIRQKEINDEIKALKKEMQTLDGDALTVAQHKLGILELEKKEQNGIVEAIMYEKDELDKTYDKLLDKLETKNKDLDTTRKEIEEIQKLQDDYEELILAQAGITAEKGRGLEKIDEELKKIDEAKKKLGEKLRNQEINTLEYQEQNEKLDAQRTKLLKAQEELQEINKLAGETIYDKEVKIKSNPSIDRFNKELSSPIWRYVNLRYNREPVPLPTYASGTDSHPGGPAIVGEEGFELAKMGNRWAMLDLGVYDLPRGTQVFTHDESRKIIQALNRLPAYADGVSRSGEVDRVVGQLNRREEPRIVQHITIQSPEPTSPSENARKFKLAQRQLALEWGW